MHVGSTFENNIKELDLRKACKYLGIEESFDIQHKNEKEKLKKKYPRRQTSFWYRIKCKEKSNGERDSPWNIPLRI